MRKALEGLIASQEVKVAALEITLAQNSSQLDQCAVRTMVFRNVFGPAQTETLQAESEAQEASRPVTETTAELEHERAALTAFRAALELLEAGRSLHELGPAESMQAQPAGRP